MKCTKCGLDLDAGAKFCGNCGQQIAGIPVTAGAASNVVAYAGMPAYAAPAIAPSTGGGKAIASMILGILGIPCSIVPILGLGLGIGALVLGIMSLKSPRKGFAIAGIVFSVPAILFSLLLWLSYTLVLMQDPKTSRINIPVHSRIGAEAGLPLVSLEAVLVAGFTFRLNEPVNY